MFWENFLNLCAKNSTNPSAVCKNLGFSNATATHWKQGAQPNSSTLVKLAEYFNVTVEYFIKEPDQTKKLPASDEEFVEMLREHNKGKAQIFFCGADGKVVEVPPEAEAILKSVIDTFNPNNPK